MAKKLIIEYKGTFITISVGDTLSLSEGGQAASLGMEGDIVRVTGISPSRYSMDSKIQVVRNNPHPGWGNLSGRVMSHTGLSLYIGDVLIYFDLEAPPGDMYISKDFIFRSRNLKSLNCRFLAKLQNGDYFMEFEEDIAGCSCDGLGKMGHCIIVGQGFLTKREPKKKKKTKKED